MGLEGGLAHDRLDALLVPFAGLHGDRPPGDEQRLHADEDAEGGAREDPAPEGEKEPHREERQDEGETERDVDDGGVQR
jgi:hypothetical protein